MPDTANLEIKKFISRAILAGLIGAVAVFAYVLFLPKKYEITGKIVVFPAGSETTEKNLGLEVGNTVQIINGSAFVKNYFQGEEKNFLKAKLVKNSSTVEVIFLSELSERAAVEDILVKVPQDVAEYARDLYGGSPFKYKLLSDPEISSGPARPNLYKYLGSGFAAGIILFFFYWLFFEFLRVPAERKETREENIEMPVIPSVDFRVEEPISKPKAVAEEETTEPVYEYEMPVREAPAKETEPIYEKAESAAPDNLPILEMGPAEHLEISLETPPLPTSEYHEPTDQEVKDRLNKLMRGEL